MSVLRMSAEVCRVQRFLNGRPCRSRRKRGVCWVAVWQVLLFKLVIKSSATIIIISNLLHYYYSRIPL
jgi:hypothetical protein